MKLQHLTVIFVIIMLPIILILSYYIQTQIDTATLRDLYRTALMNSTHDAMSAFELNTMNNNYSDNAESFKRDVEAAINTFFKSMSNNLGVTGYTKQYIEPYIPAIVFTGYDGYYIYAKNKTTDRYTKEDEKAGRGEEGKVKLDENSNAIEVTNYQLKPYTYYSARYVTGNTNIVINYTLDNYITIYGMLDGKYVTKSGYIVTTNNEYIDNEILQETVVTEQTYIEGDNGNLWDNSLKQWVIYNGDEIQSVQSTGDSISNISTANKVKKITQINECEYEFYEIDNFIYKVYNSEFDDNIKFYISSNNNRTYICNINETEGTAEVMNGSVINPKINIKKVNANTYNNERIDLNTEFKKLTEIKISDYKDANNETPEKFAGNNNYIFSGDNIENQGSIFNEHKKEVMKLSIEENLRVALANYANNSTYKLPKLTDTDWENIFSNISMITFMQDMPVKYTTFNDYVIASSTGNKEYIPDNGVYFIDEDTNIYHKITCESIKDKTAGLIGYKAVEFERNSIVDDEKKTRYYYKHSATACYECIVSSNYPSLYVYDNNGKLKLNIESDYLKQAYYTALARERITQYKSTSFLR